MMGPGGPGPAPGPSIVRAYRVSAADGAETLVRGLRFGTVAHGAFRDIVEASKERRLHSVKASLPQPLQMAAMIQGGGPPPEVVFSLITPDLLFGELEIEKPDRPFQRPPIAPSPLRAP
jgi:hypothetical protein